MSRVYATLLALATAQCIGCSGSVSVGNGTSSARDEPLRTMLNYQGVEAVTKP